MERYDDEFELLFSILKSLKEYYKNCFDGESYSTDHKRNMAYITDRITNLLDPQPKPDPLSSIRKTCDDFFDSIHPKPPAIDPNNLPKDYMDDVIPANMDEEIYFAPDDTEYEFYSVSTDDVDEKPPNSKVMP